MVEVAGGGFRPQTIAQVHYMIVINSTYIKSLHSINRIYVTCAHACMLICYISLVV